MHKLHPSEQYALDVVNGEICAGKYVIKQCGQVLDIWHGKSEKYCLNDKLRHKIDLIFKALKMPKGPSAGSSIYKALAGYQWFFIDSVLCTVSRQDRRMRKYQKAILEIARKNGKTFDVALIFLVLFYMEPQYSRFFSVAPDGQLAREIKEALEPLIRENATVMQDGEFKILRDYILHKPTKTKYTPLNFSTNRMDGKEPNVFIADEIGALPTAYPIEAMQSGQLLVKNRLGFLISTKYPTETNPMEDEVDYAKKVLDGVVEDDAVFALLYEPDDTAGWASNDEVLKHANPLALEIPTVWDDLIKKRQRAIEIPSTRENFITKHCNIIYQGVGTESYIPAEALQKCRIKDTDGRMPKIVWTGKEVFVGVDLSLTNDNTSVVMLGIDDDGNMVAMPMCFIPEGRIAEKSAVEKVDYWAYIRRGWCIPCGDLTIDYAVVEDYVFGLEEKYGVTILGIGYDRYNALSSAQKWADKYDCVEVRQHSDTLHAPMKFLYEEVMGRRFKYEENTLFEINFENVRIRYDTTLRMIMDKKRSTGKIDMVAALVDAVYLYQQSGLQSSAKIIQGIDEFLAD